MRTPMWFSAINALVNIALSLYPVSENRRDRALPLPPALPAGSMPCFCWRTLYWQKPVPDGAGNSPATVCFILLASLAMGDGALLRQAACMATDLLDGTFWYAPVVGSGPYCSAVHWSISSLCWLTGAIPRKQSERFAPRETIAPDAERLANAQRRSAITPQIHVHPHHRYPADRTFQESTNDTAYQTGSFPAFSPPAICILGNYLGAIRKFVAMQESHECIYCVVDLHAITQPFSVWGGPEKLGDNTREVTAAYLAAGIDPKKHIVFNQSQVARTCRTGLDVQLCCPHGLAEPDDPVQGKGRQGPGKCLGRTVCLSNSDGCRYSACTAQPMCRWAMTRSSIWN